MKSAHKKIAVALAALFFSFGALAQESQEKKPEEPPKFEITRFNVEGNTLLPQEEIAGIMAAHTGTGKDFGDVQRALEALQNAYIKRGYTAVLVLLPEQELEQGVVQIRVMESRVGKVVVQGNRYFDETNVRSSIPSLQEGVSPNSILIAESLRLANENPSKQETVVMKTSEQEGIVDATIRVADEKPWKVSAALDNTGNEQTGKTRLGVGYRHANMFNRDHVLTAQYITSPEELDKVSIYGVGYRIPLYSLGDSVEFFAGYSDVSSGVVENLFNVSGAGTIFGARYNHLLRKIGEKYDQKLVYGYDYREYRNQVTPIGSTVNIIPDVSVQPLSLTYVGNWKMTSAESGFFVSVSHNIPGGPDGSDGDFQALRVTASNDYTIFRYGANYTRALPQDVLMRMAFNGQHTNDALVPGEQFGLGGADSVRGFLEREIANDRGYRASAEVYSPDFGGKMGIANSRARALAFYDFGGVKRNDVLPGEKRGEFVSSIGVGLRVSVGGYVNFRADLAQVVADGGTQGSGDTRAHFSLSVVY